MRRIHVMEDYDRMGGEVYFKHEEKERIMRDPELREAYMCGRKDAYKEIMEEQYGERNYRTMPPMYRGGRDGMNYRDEPEWNEYEERRRRDSRGRYM